MFLSEGGHFYVDMHFYATFFARLFHITMHFYAMLFTYADLSE